LTVRAGHAFGGAQTIANYDVSLDGQCFVMVKDDSASGRLNVVLNWTEELKARVPLPSRLILRARHGGFGRLKSNLRMRAVAERLGGGGPAATQRDGVTGNRVRIAVPIENSDILTLDSIRPVLTDANDSWHDDSKTP
jgi:hypothetical protein